METEEIIFRNILSILDIYKKGVNYGNYKEIKITSKLLKELKNIGTICSTQYITLPLNDLCVKEINFLFDLANVSFSDDCITSVSFGIPDPLLYGRDHNIGVLWGIYFKRAKLTKVLFADASLTNIDFSGATLTQVSFWRDTLVDVNFRGATLIDVRFIDSALTGIDFSGATLINVSFINVQLSRLCYNKTYTATIDDWTKYFTEGQDIKCDKKLRLKM